MIWLLLTLPILAGIASFRIRDSATRRGLLVGVGVVHLALSLGSWTHPALPQAGDWLALDTVGRIFLTLSSVLFLASALAAIEFFRSEHTGGADRLETGVFFSTRREANATALMHFLLATLTLATCSQHFGLLWVAVEAGTLASAPLVFFRRSARSLEACWKYIQICSVGMALVLLGNFFLVVAVDSGKGEVPLVLTDLLAHGKAINRLWLKATFLFFLIGYGTKLGLAPMHTWLPDAYSEAPASLFALLSGALANCGLLGILRIQQVCQAADLAAFGQELLIGFGLLSMLCAGVFILGQPDYKRMLAYAGVEQAGVLAFGIGIGGAAVTGAMLHAIAGSLCKGMMFVVSDNIQARYRTRASAEVRGLSRVLPLSGALWVCGLLALTGSPPFGLFLSEFTILKGVLDQGRGGLAAVYLGLLALVFVGMATPVLRMAEASVAARPAPPAVAERALAVVPAAGLGLLVLGLGVYLPPALSDALHRTAAVLGGF